MKSKLTNLILLVAINFQLSTASEIPAHLIEKYKSYCEKNSYNCLKLNMLMEIRKMGRHKFYRITDDVWLARVQPNVTLENDSDNVKLNKSDIKLNKIVAELNDVFKTHSLFMNVVPGKDLEIYRRNPDGRFNMKLEGDSTSYPYFVDPINSSTNTGESRTFGFARRRLMMAIIPIMFKMGVMMTMMVVLLFLTLKSVTIGGLLLFIAVTSILSKFKHWISPHHHASSEKNIHVHIHTDGHQWGSSSHVEPHSIYPHSSYGSYSDGSSWNRQETGSDTITGVVNGHQIHIPVAHQSGDNAISGVLNGHHIHIPLPSGRSPTGFSSPSAMYSASEDVSFLGKAASR